MKTAEPHRATTGIKLLHTSDWHIGRILGGRKRYEEFEAFLGWLAECIEREQVNVLIVAGDIFDTTTPSNRAHQLYLGFLCRVTASAVCRHIVITAGNHDSPSFLNAPKELLRHLNVHVIGSASINPEEDVLILTDPAGEPELIVCAVPYLRDRDIRLVEEGESASDKEQKMLEGIRSHYQKICAAAEQLRNELGKPIPIVATGHLFTAGGQTQDGDGVRELYIGSLARVGTEIFPACIDYVALGHLHAPQKVGNSEVRRYCGSPLAMSFGEARQQKQVLLVSFNQPTPTVFSVPVPTFQELERIQGDWETITDRLAELKESNSTAWLEIIYEGSEIIGDLRGQLEALIAGTHIEIMPITNKQVIQHVLSQSESQESLGDLTFHDVFARCLDVHQVPDGQRACLLSAYHEIVQDLQEEDCFAE